MVDGTNEMVRSVQVGEKVLKRNDEVASENRRYLQERGIKSLNMISSPGSGKTLLLERTLEMLRGEIACAVIVGDQQTDNDARRLAGRGAPVQQIETGNTCHLDAQRVAPCLAKVISADTRLLFIENVGNLICPGSFDLGEDQKVVLLSVTEGEDKPAKYPAIFSRAAAVVITKIDLVPHLDWDRGRCLRYLEKVAPGAAIFELSAKSGEGMPAWIQYLKHL